ncbi:MAG: serine/threonine protein kinase, partial [Chloroflexi bacterium]
MIGRTLAGTNIIDQIGQGGMATVYKAYDPKTDRYVAIKILPEHFAKDETFLIRFENEARAIAKLEHIHILPIFSYGEEDGIMYMVMRYMDTGTLADLIKQGALSFKEASKLLKQIASALDYAHSHNIIHRDIKPSNVLIDNLGNAYLTDFGIAKIVEGQTQGLTGTGLIGTPQYMSPEQCRGEKELTPASDQYSLGIVLYEMVTGKTPYQADTPLAVIYMHVNSEPLTPPSQLRPNLTDAVEQVILKAMANDPADRFPTCGALAEAFAEAVNRSDTVAAITRKTIIPKTPETVQSKDDAQTTVVKPEKTGGRRLSAPVLFIATVGMIAFIIAAAILLQSANSNS